MKAAAESFDGTSMPTMQERNANMPTTAAATPRRGPRMTMMPLPGLTKEPSGSSLTSTTATSMGDDEESSTTSLSQVPAQLQALVARGNHDGMDEGSTTTTTRGLPQTIQPWHVVLGDSNSRNHRTTPATKLLRKIKRQHLQHYKGQRKDFWIPKAMDAFAQELSRECYVTQATTTAKNDIGLVLVKCTPKARDRIATPHTHAYPGEEALYGVANQAKALEFFLSSRDPPLLADEVARHARNWEILKQQQQQQPPAAMMDNFAALLSFVQSQLDRAEQGDTYAASILDSLSPINKLKIHWRTLVDSSSSCCSNGSQPRSGAAMSAPATCPDTVQPILAHVAASTAREAVGSHESETETSTMDETKPTATTTTTVSRPPSLIPVGLPLYAQVCAKATARSLSMVDNKEHDGGQDELWEVIPPCANQSAHECVEQGCNDDPLCIFDEELGAMDDFAWKHDDLDFLLDASHVDALEEPVDPTVCDLDECAVPTVFDVDDNDQECPTFDHFQLQHFLDEEDEDDQEEPTLPLIRDRDDHDDETNAGGQRPKRMRVAGMAVLGLLACVTIVVVPITHTLSENDSSPSSSVGDAGHGLGQNVTPTESTESNTDDSNIEWWILVMGCLLAVLCLPMAILWRKVGRRRCRLEWQSHRVPQINLEE